MRQRNDSPDPRRGYRRTAILMAASLLIALIIRPDFAPIIGGVAMLILLWGVIQHYAAAPMQADTGDKREPALWDDGFGAT